MNPEAEKILKGIVLKEVEALTEEEILFLRSRRSYLTASEQERYSSVLEPKEKKPKEKIEK